MNEELKEDRLTFEQAWAKEDYRDDLTEEGISSLGYFLEPQYLFSNIIKKAKAITKGKKTNKDKANAILKWVQINKKYEWYGNTYYGAINALYAKKLNCQDSAQLVVALLRACNIPAKFAMKDNKTTGHCWPKVYIGGKWLSGQPTTNPYHVEFGSTKNLRYDWDKSKAWTYDLNSYNCNSKMIKSNGKWYHIYEKFVIGGKTIYHYDPSMEHVSLYIK